MPSFTARLSDGSMFTVDAPSREVAEGILRTENEYRSRKAAANPITGRPMEPGQLEALRTLPPPPTEPLRTPMANQLAAQGPVPQPAPEQGGASLGRQLKFIGTGLGMTAEAARPALETLGAAGALAATGGAATPLVTAGALGRAGLAAGLGGAAGSLGASLLEGDVTPGEAYRRAGEAAVFEPLALAAGEAGAAGLKAGARHFAKLNTQLATLADQYGIRMGVEDLSMRGALRRVRTMFGRFPYVSTPFQESSKRVSQDIGRAVQERFDAVAPVEIDPYVVSKRTINEARGLWEHYRGRTNTLYEEWRTHARTSRVEFSPNITRTRAQELLDESSERLAQFERTNPLTGEREATRAKLQPDPLSRLAKKVTELADGQSIDVYDALKKDIQSVQAKLKNPHDRARLGTLLEGLELDLRSTVTDPESARLLERADRYYRAGKSTFETATARRLGTFQEGIFETGSIPKPTKRDIQDIASNVFGTGNRAAVREYRALVGDRTFREATRLHLQDAFHGSLEFVTSGKDEGKVILRMQKLSNNLGLFTPGSERRAALHEMLKGTGTTVNDLENLVRLAQRASEMVPVDVSTFASRRAVMGGTRAAVGTFLPGADTNINSTVGIVREGLKLLTFVTEGGAAGRWLTDPRVVKDLTNVFKPGISQSARTAAILRVGRLIERDTNAGEYSVPLSGATGAAVGGATRMFPPTLLRTPLGAAVGAGQAALGAGLSRAASAPFQPPVGPDLEALRRGR